MNSGMNIFRCWNQNSALDASYITCQRCLLKKDKIENGGTTFVLELLSGLNEMKCVQCPKQCQAFRYQFSFSCKPSFQFFLFVCLTAEKNSFIRRERKATVYFQTWKWAQAREERLKRLKGSRGRLLFSFCLSLG